MTDYHQYGVNLTVGQVKKMKTAQKKGTGTSIRLPKNNLEGNHMLPLTQTQINKIKKVKAKAGVQLNLSAAQLSHMEKTGGFLPLLALIPLIAGAVGAAGGLTGGISAAVSAAKSNAEQARHNRVIEEQLKSGTGIVSDSVGKIPLIGNFLKPVLKKIGLGIQDCNKINSGGCICKHGLLYKKQGNGLYLEPQGNGLFLGP